MKITNALENVGGGQNADLLAFLTLSLSVIGGVYND